MEAKFVLIFSETIFRYLKIQKKIQEDLNVVKVKKKEVKENGEKLEIEMETEKHHAEEAKRAAEEFKKQEKKVNEDLQILKHNRDILFNVAGKPIR